MSKGSALNAPEKWQKIVISWCRRNGLEGLSPIPSRRVVHDIEILASIALLGGAQQQAATVLSYICAASVARKPLEPGVLRYLEVTRERYCVDPKRNIGKALGLVRTTPGNPGRTHSAKRRNTSALMSEIGEIVRASTASGQYEKRIVWMLHKQYGLSERTIRIAAAKVRADRLERSDLSREFPLTPYNAEFPE